MSNQLERVGTAERDAAAALIADAAAAGYLDTDEFTERSAAAFAARTRADLDAVLADVPPAFVQLRKAAGRRERHAGAPGRAPRRLARPSAASGAGPVAGRRVDEHRDPRPAARPAPRRDRPARRGHGGRRPGG